MLRIYNAIGSSFWVGENMMGIIILLHLGFKNVLILYSKCGIQIKALYCGFFF